VSVVGIIANPSSGKDIRRLVAMGSVVDNTEKVNIVKRVLTGLRAAGVDRVIHMPDGFGIARRAVESMRGGVEVLPIEMPMVGSAVDSRRAAELMAADGVACIITLGGDGTNRAIAAGAGVVPLVAISTGTNNVFPTQVEGTLAGLAAGLIATRRVDATSCVTRSKRLVLRVDDGPEDFALVDVALVREAFVGARAVWRSDLVEELFLAIAEPGSIGLSAIGAHLRPVARGDPFALRVILGSRDTRVHRGGSVLAPIAPGLVVRAEVSDYSLLRPFERIEARPLNGVVALDGERELAVTRNQRVTVELRLDGPTVVDVGVALRVAAESGILVDWR